MKKALAALCVIAAFVLMLTGCQKGTGNAVRYKGEDNIKKAIEQGEATEKYTAESNWKETVELDNGKMTLNFDAKVTLPEQDKIPVATVELTGINQEMVDKFINCFSEGKPIYEERGEIVTKSEIEAEILKLKEGKNSDLKAEDPKAYEELIKQDIKNLEKKYQTAPEVYERVISDGKLKGETFTCEIDKKQTMLLMVANYSKKVNKILYGVKGAIQISDDEASDKLKDLNDLSISANDAQGQADKLMTNLGFDEEYKLAKVCSVYITTKEDKWLYDYPQGYAFYYTRNVNGVVSNLSLQFETSAATKEEDYDEYAEAAEEEIVRIVVDDRGIVDFSFTTPMKQTKIEAENVKLLPFSEIKEIAKKQMAYMGAYDTYELIEHHTINIKEVKLGMARVLKKDNPDEYYMVPVWDFYGTDVQKYSKKDEGGYILNDKNEYEANYAGHSFLTINAMDGSIINRGKGY